MVTMPRKIGSLAITRTFMTSPPPVRSRADAVWPAYRPSGGLKARSGLGDAGDVLDHGVGVSWSERLGSTREPPWVACRAVGRLVSTSMPVCSRPRLPVGRTQSLEHSQRSHATSRSEVV